MAQVITLVIGVIQQCLFVRLQFTSDDPHVVRRLDPDCYPIAGDAMHHHPDVFANHQLFANLATEN
jgi:hypothetical protein